MDHLLNLIETLIACIEMIDFFIIIFGKTLRYKNFEIQIFNQTKKRYYYCYF